MSEYFWLLIGEKNVIMYGDLSWTLSWDEEWSLAKVTTKYWNAEIPVLLGTKRGTGCQRPPPPLNPTLAK